MQLTPQQLALLQAQQQMPQGAIQQAQGQMPQTMFPQGMPPQGTPPQVQRPVMPAQAQGAPQGNQAQAMREKFMALPPASKEKFLQAMRDMKAQQGQR